LMEPGLHVNDHEDRDVDPEPSAKIKGVTDIWALPKKFAGRPFVYKVCIPCGNQFGSAAGQVKAVRTDGKEAAILPICDRCTNICLDAKLLLRKGCGTLYCYCEQLNSGNKILIEQKNAATAVYDKHVPWPEVRSGVVQDEETRVVAHKFTFGWTKEGFEHQYRATPEEKNVKKQTMTDHRSFSGTFYPVPFGPVVFDQQCAVSIRKTDELLAPEKKMFEGMQTNVYVAAMRERNAGKDSMSHKLHGAAGGSDPKSQDKDKVTHETLMAELELQEELQPSGTPLLPGASFLSPDLVLSCLGLPTAAPRWLGSSDNVYDVFVEEGGRSD